MVKQIAGEYETQGARMTKYLAEVKDRLQYFGSYSFQGVDISDNTVVDALSKLAITEASSFSDSVYLEVLNVPSIQRLEVLCIERSNYWLTPYLNYLSDGVLPSDQLLAKKMMHKSLFYTLIDGDLYRTTFFLPY